MSINNNELKKKNKNLYLTIYEAIEDNGHLSFYLYEFILFKKQYQNLNNFDYNQILFPKNTNLYQHYNELNILNTRDKKILYSFLDDYSKEELNKLLTDSILNFKTKSLTATPNSLVEFASYLIKNNKPEDEMLDICCGAGNFISYNATNHKYANYFGIENNLSLAIIAEIELLLLNVNFKIEVDNPLNNNNSLLNPTNKFQHIFSNFPFGLRHILKEYRPKDNLISLNPKSSSDYYFIDLILNNLKPEGKAIVIMPEPSLTNQIDLKIRKELVEKGFIEAIYTLPNNLFSTTSIKTYLVVLSFNNQTIKMADLSEYYLNISKRKRALDLVKISKNLDKELKIITLFDIEKNDYNLKPDLYIIDKVFLKNSKTLAEISQIFTGWQITTKGLEQRYSENGTTSIIQITDIKNYQIHLNKKYHVEAEYQEKYQLQKGDIIITAKSTKVEFAVIQDKEIAAIPASTLTVIRLKPEFNPYYVVSFFESISGKNLIKAHQTGSVIKNLTPNNLKQIPIPIVDLYTQEKIAKEFKETIDKINFLEKETTKLKEKLINNQHFI